MVKSLGDVYCDCNGYDNSQRALIKDKYGNYSCNHCGFKMENPLTTIDKLDSRIETIDKVLNIVLNELQIDKIEILNTIFKGES